MPLQFKTDWFLFGTVLAMVSFGLLVVYSASSVTAQTDPKFGYSLYFVVRQAGWAILSITIMMILKRTPYHKFNNAAVAFPAVSVVLLMLAAAYVADGHHRWLRFGHGAVGVQPSEIAKIALVIFLAFFVSWRGAAINTRYTLWPMATAVGLVLFSVVVADLGTALVLAAAAGVVLFVAGLRPRYLLIVATLGLLGVAVSVYLEPYRLVRIYPFIPKAIMAKIDPHDTIHQHMQKSLGSKDNYQVDMSIMAIGSGGVTGLGPGNGKHKLFVPENQTDMILSVAGEEAGMFGTVGLLLGFCVIAWRGLRAAWRLRNQFGGYLALAITTILVTQALINMSVAVGIVPAKGIPLPLISYGGSSLLSSLAMLGMLMNVSEHAG
jgi:cell division protein FtsW